MFPPATPGSTLYKHPGGEVLCTRMSLYLYKQLIHLSLYLREVFPRCYAHSTEKILSVAITSTIEKCDRG